MPLLHRLKASLAGKVMSGLPIEKMIPKLVEGVDSSEQAGELAKGLGITRVLVVTDAILMSLGVVTPAIESLKASGIDVVVFDKVLPDPATEQVLEGAALYQSSKCDGLIAVGGGSSIDCAKIIGAHVSDPRPISEIAGAMKLKKAIPPLLAICTTHGTGSETTFAAVITSVQEQRKFLISDFKLFPKVAILDPTVVKGLPPAVTAATGMDAMTHAVEAYVSPWATDKIRERAAGAIGNIIKYLPRCYENGTKDTEARAAMLKASFDAGVCINVAAVGYVHAIAHTVGALYHTPHGDANSMILPYVLDHYGDAAAPQLAQLAKNSNIGSPGDSDSKLAKAFVQNLRDMSTKMNMHTTVKGLEPSAVGKVATLALEEAHGERHSVIWSFGDFMKDCGYPTCKYMSHADCERIVSKLIPADAPRKAKL